MSDLKQLVEALKREVNGEDRQLAFDNVVKGIELFYKESFGLNDYEVAMFLVNSEKTVLSFACPAYLINSGMIPVSSTESYAASIYRSGRSVIENNLQQQKHLGIFEIIRTPDSHIKTIWKMMGALIAIEEDKIGVIEISRRAVNQMDAGEDFGESDLRFLTDTIKILAPFIRKVLPENFRGKIT